MTPVEIRKALDMTDAIWNKYLMDGSIIKAPNNNAYVLGDVAAQVIRYQRSLYRAQNTTVMTLNRKIKNLESREVAAATAVKQDINFAHPDIKKKILDIKLGERKIRKMDFDHKIRTRDYIPKELLGEVVSKLASEFAGQLDPITMGLKQAMPSMSSRVFSDLNKVMAKARNSMARYQTGEVVGKFIAAFDPEGDSAIIDTAKDT